MHFLTCFEDYSIKRDQCKIRFFAQYKAFCPIHSELLQKNDKNLFVKKFCKYIWHTSKLNLQTLEILWNTFLTKYKLFCHGLPKTPRTSFGGQRQRKILLGEGTTSQYSKNRYNNCNQNSYGYGYDKYKPGNPVQQNEISLCSSSGGSKSYILL